MRIFDKMNWVKYFKLVSYRIVMQEAFDSDFYFCKKTMPEVCKDKNL